MENSLYENVGGKSSVIEFNKYSDKTYKSKSKSINFGQEEFESERKITYIYNRNPYIKDMDMEVGADMDENRLLEKYLDKVDQDRREQELRLNSNMDKLEERLSRERIASEERLEKMFNATMESIKDTNNKIDSINSKIDSKIDLMYEKMDSTNKWIIGTCIATILAVAAIAASVWF